MNIKYLHQIVEVGVEERRIDPLTGRYVDIDLNFGGVDSDQQRAVLERMLPGEYFITKM